MARREDPPSTPPDGSGWSPLALAAFAAAWTATLCNLPLWRTLAALPELASARGTLFIIGFSAMVALLTLVLLAPFAWPRSIKPAIAFVLLSAALGAHFMGSYGVVIDPTMMVNVLQTDPREARDLLSLRLAATVLLLAGVPIGLLWRLRVARSGVAARLLRNALATVAAIVALTALLFALSADLSATMRNHKSVRYLINPVNSYWALGVIAVDAQARPKGPLLAIGTDAKVVPRIAGKPPLLLLVIGETARADHFALNGYARPTNPELAPLGVVSLRDVTSCGTSTAASLPCMFSHLGRQGYEVRAQDHENLLDLAQRAGLAVLWIDNQSGCKGLCERVPNAMASAPPPSDLCETGECFDAALLQGLDARIAALPADRRARGTLIVLHQMGSHGPAYFKRSPPARKPFLPECTSNALQQCDRQALVNAYDNSIAYTDHVLARTIDWLKQHQASDAPVLLYVSDHGESLGENNLYLHGLPFAVAPRAQTHVPMLLWWPPASDATVGTPLACAERQRDTPLSHDNLFHTVLGLLSVQAREYRPALDALQACRAG